MSQPSAPPSPVPPVETLTPDQATAEIAQIRGNVAHDFHHEGRPGHDAALERLDQLYQRLAGHTPPTEPPAEPTEATSEPPSRLVEDREALAWTFDRPPVPEGQEWDERAELALRALTHMHDVPVAEVQAATHDYRAAWDRRAMDPEARREARDAALEQAWGDHVDLKLARAAAMAQELPPRLLQHAQQVGMHYDAPIWLRLAALWERKYQ